jgi:hypothetical protein
MAWKFSVLVVANVTGTAPELIQALKERAGRDTCGFVLLVPATGGGTGGREAAERRIAEALERMREEGLEVEGRIGDPDPILAVNDVWDPKEFDEVIVSTLPTGSSKWLAIDLPRRIEKITGVQVSHVVSQPPKEEVKTAPAPEPERYGVLAPFAALAPKARRAASRTLGRRSARTR